MDTKKLQVTVTIQPGEASPAQMIAWRRFWQQLLAEIKTGEQA